MTMKRRRERRVKQWLPSNAGRPPIEQPHMRPWRLWHERRLSNELSFGSSACVTPSGTTRQQLRWLTKSGHHSHTNGMCVRGW